MSNRAARRSALGWCALLLVAGACDTPATPDRAAAAPDVGSCDRARDALEKHLASVPRQCKADTECRAQYVRADACAAPVVTSARWKPESDMRLVALQAEIHKVCPMAKRNCGPPPATPACRLGTCVDDRGPSGIMKAECAPNDGPAVTFALTEGQQARCDESVYPVVTATLWRAVIPGDRFTLDPAQKGGEGVLMRCQTAGQCATGSGSVHIVGAHEGGLIVEIDASFEGAPVKQSFWAQPCPGQPTCG